MEESYEGPQIAIQTPRRLSTAMKNPLEYKHTRHTYENECKVHSLHKINISYTHIPLQSTGFSYMLLPTMKWLVKPAKFKWSKPHLNKLHYYE